MVAEGTGIAEIGSEGAGRAHDVKGVAGTHVVDEPGGEDPLRYDAHADAGRCSGRCADGVRTALVASAELPAKGEALAGEEGELVGQMLRDVEGEGGGVGAQRLHGSHAQSMESRTAAGPYGSGRCGVGHQSSLMCGKGSRQARQRRRAVQAVAAKRESSSVSMEAQRGQGTPAGSGVRDSQT